MHQDERETTTYTTESQAHTVNLLHENNDL